MTAEERYEALDDAALALYREQRYAEALAHITGRGGPCRAGGATWRTPQPACTP